MLPELTNFVLSEWKDLFPKTKKPKKIDYLAIPGSIGGGTTTFLAFSDEQEKPIFVVKTHRATSEQKIVLNERDALNNLHSKSGFFKESIPRAVLCRKFGDYWFLVQSALDGKIMLAKIGSNDYPEKKTTAKNMALVKEWLVNLHKLTRKKQLTVPQAIKKYAFKQLAEFEKLFELPKSERNFLKQLKGAINSFDENKVDIVLQHGDFCRQNILVSGRNSEQQLRAVDWAFSKRESLPLYDLFFFITTYFLQSRRSQGIGSFVNAFEDTFFNKNAYRKIVKQCVTEYCEQLRIDLSVAKTLFAFFLIDRAVFEYHQLQKCAKNCEFPRFVLYLASIKKSSFNAALKELPWIYFFSVFSKRQANFII